jgi:hypothetical protein
MSRHTVTHDPHAVLGLVQSTVLVPVQEVQRQLHEQCVPVPEPPVVPPPELGASVDRGTQTPSESQPPLPSQVALQSAKQ